MRLVPSAAFWLQIIQLYEMIIVRHGLMLVGAPFSGKSVGLRLLAGALTDLHGEGKQGTLFEKVEMRVINPKSVTMGQLYGEVDKATQEWKVRHSALETRLLLVPGADLVQAAVATHGLMATVPAAFTHGKSESRARASLQW